MKKQYTIDWELYSWEILNAAIQSYTEYGIDISFDDSILTICSEDDDVEEIFGEFMNYIISLEC